MGDGEENEAESAIFLSWFSLFDSADGDLLWDKMDVSTWLSLCIFKVFVGIAGLLLVFCNCCLKHTVKPFKEQQVLHFSRRSLISSVCTRGLC